MTTDIAVPIITHTVAGTGPYAVPWPYGEGELVVWADLDGEITPLTNPAQWTASPTSTLTGGEITLAGAVASGFEDALLVIERATVQEQGWQGVQGREIGLTAALDRTMRAVQDLKGQSGGMLRILGKTNLAPIAEPVEGSAVIWDGDKFAPGPTADDIALAQGYAEQAQAAADSIIYTQFFERSVIGDGTIAAIMFPGIYTVKDHFVDVNVGGVPQGPDRFSLVPLEGNTYLTFGGPIPLGLKASAKATQRMVVSSGGYEIGGRTYPDLASFLADSNVPQNGDLRNVVLPNNRVATYLRNTSAINGGLVSKPGFAPALTVDVTMFGAVGDSDKAKKAANTAAIQEAFLYAENHPIGRRRTVIFPEGYFWVGDRLRLSQGGLSLRMLNKNSRLRREDDYGDTIYWAAVDPTVTRLTDIEITDLYCDNQGEMTNGDHLHLSDMIRVQTSGLNLWNGFGGIRARGLQKWNDSHSTMSAGEAWDPDPFLPGSHYVAIEPPQNPANKSTEIGFTQPNWCRTGVVTDVPRVEHGLLFAEGDGVWIAGGHIFGADACVRHKPSDATRICTGLKLTGTWLDQWSSRHYSAEGNTTGGFGGVDLIGVRGLNAREKSIHIGTECVDFHGLDIKGGRYSIAFGGTDHIDIGAGSRFTIDANVVSRQAMSAGARGIRIQDAARNVVIADGTAIACDAATGPLAIGIQVDTANPTVTVGKVAFHGVTQEFSLPNPIPGTSSYAISKSTRTPFNIESVTVSGGTISLPFLASSFDITGTAGDLVDIIGGQEGRVVELRAIGAQFVIRHNTGASGSRIRTPWSGPLVLRAGASVTLRYSARASAWLAQPQDVVRSGSNSNGSFVEYADGRTECRHTLTSSVAEDVVWTFPQAIISEVGATVTVTPRTNSSTPKITASRVPTTTTAAIAVYNRDDTRAAVAVSLEMKGRWHNET